MRKNQNLLDQFFLQDEEAIRDLVESASLKKNDIVLEIGAGKGTITRKLAKKAGRVIAVEIDEMFRNDLKTLPTNVEVIFGNALKVLEKNLKFNKIVASLPSSIVEPLTMRMINYKFREASVLVPLKFAFKLVKDQFFTAFFAVKIVKKISRTAFSPMPRTNWALVTIVRKPNPLKTGEKDRFLKQYLYYHQKAKRENALAEGLIKFYRFQGKQLTKRQAKALVANQNPL